MSYFRCILATQPELGVLCSPAICYMVHHIIECAILELYPVFHDKPASLETHTLFCLSENRNGKNDTIPTINKYSIQKAVKSSAKFTALHECHTAC